MDILGFTNKSTDILLKELSETNIYKGKVFRLMNMHNISLISKDLHFRTTMARNSISIIDSFPLRIILILKHRRQIHQIRGTDLLRTIIFSLHGKHTQLFVCPNIETAEVINRKLRNLKTSVVSQFLIPPTFANHEGLLQYLHTNFPVTSFDFVWLGIGTPKQDFVASVLSDKYPNSTFFCVGAALEYFAGLKKEAPRTIQFIGLEWLFRLLSEPRRLYKRYLFEALPAFFYIIKKRTKIL